MPPTRFSCALVAATLLLTACTGSSDDSATTGASTAGAAGSPSGSSPAPAGSHVSPTVAATASGTRTGGSSGSVAPTPLSTMIRQGVHATYTVRVWAQRTSTDCAARAYGPSVPAYLQSHTCRRVVRYLGTTTANGRAVGISGSTVTFRGTTAAAGQSAAGLAALLSVPAKGGIADLFRDGGRLPRGPSSLPARVAANSRNDGATVTVIDAWYLSGRTSADDPALSELLEAIT